MTEKKVWSNYFRSSLIISKLLNDFLGQVNFKGSISFLSGDGFDLLIFYIGFVLKYMHDLPSANFN